MVTSLIQPIKLFSVLIEDLFSCALGKILTTAQKANRLLLIPLVRIVRGIKEMILSHHVDYSRYDVLLDIAVEEELSPL